LLVPRLKGIGLTIRLAPTVCAEFAARPVGAAELTDLVQLNHNAVCRHLAVLDGADLVAAEVEINDRPDRPERRGSDLPVTWEFAASIQIPYPAHETWGN